MAITKYETDGVISDEFPVVHGNARKILSIISAVSLAKNINLSLVFCTWGLCSQIIHGEEGLVSILPDYGNLSANGLHKARLLHQASESKTGLADELEVLESPPPSDST